MWNGYHERHFNHLGLNLPTFYLYLERVNFYSAKKSLFQLSCSWQDVELGQECQYFRRVSLKLCFFSLLQLKASTLSNVHYQSYIFYVERKTILVQSGGDEKWVYLYIRSCSFLRTLHFMRRSLLWLVFEYLQYKCMVYHSI